MELAIDTSTDYASISLSHLGETLSELSWYTKQNHTKELVPNIDYLLRQARIETRAIEAIFVAKGPGSFNGLRVGMSTAKGFAFSLQIPLVAVSTLEIEAYPFAFAGLPICPVHNAGRGEIATALYQKTDNWRCLVSEYITTAEKLCDEVKEPTIFCGEIPAGVIEQLKQGLGDLALVPEIAARRRHASHLATLGWQRLSQGERDDPASLQPAYLRPPPITQRKVK
ncbi:MAG: tRNA (adenosine(37)-N6)-threonylcarbamoyltransferase complex dimerization subunit type 1 TsaB [Chloroflexi bacterium]|nr:tRNA (adenosine(37)-N6)-threonylcarbamoyltransferase complex dimerization subunit type 1 TsaB [Chloroflexota bacterium]MBM4454214.1 tRNA (adenosine(37)-N6)-threonylcarbamoyltransferase complex dimerization subunit type 1 TsaB [Chloroflexota bacterium]